MRVQATATLTLMFSAEYTFLPYFISSVRHPKAGSYNTRNGMEGNGTGSNYAQYRRRCRICNVLICQFGELISCPVPATKMGQAPSRQYRATPSVLTFYSSTWYLGLASPFLRLQARGQRRHYRLWAQLWGVDLPVAHPGTGSEWYCFLYFLQIRNKDHHGASASMLTSGELRQLLAQPRDFTGVMVNPVSC